MPKINRVTTYLSDGMLIDFGIYQITLGINMKDAKNLPANSLFCFS